MVEEIEQFNMFYLKITAIYYKVCTNGNTD